MSLGDLGALGSFFAAIAVFVTLIYLSRQVKQGNMLARLQVRQTMTEHDIAGLRNLLDDRGLTRAFLGRNATHDDLVRLHYFLTLSMRQREWEWFQYQERIIDENIYKTYHGVITIHLGTPISREWWETRGRAGLNPEFVSAVDELLSGQALAPYFEHVDEFAEKHKAAST